MKRKLYFLLTYLAATLFLTKANAQTQCSGWEQLGTAGFSASYSYFGYTHSIALDSKGTPYVVYEDGGNSYRATVMKYNGTQWVNLGSPGFSSSTANYTSIAISPADTVYVAFSDAGNGSRITVMKFDGTSWVYVGSPGFSTSYAYYTSLTIDRYGNPYVAFEDYAYGYGATVMTFNGTSWVTVGFPSFTGSYASYEAITTDSNGYPYITYEDGSNSYRASVMQWTGASWVYVGSPGFSPSYCYYNNIVISKTGIPYVVYEDAGNGSKATVMTFNGTSWTPVGSAGISPSYAYYESIALDTAGVPYISFADGGSGYKCIVMKFNGTSWSYLGTPDFTPNAVYSSSLVLTKNNTALVVYEDASMGDKTSVMEDISVKLLSQPTSVSTCPEGKVSFATSAYGSAGVTYQWEVNTGTGFVNVTNSSVYSGATSDTLTINSASTTMNGNKYVCRINGGCILNTDTVSLTVFNLPIITATASPSANICIGNSVALSATGGTTYSWSGGITDAVPFTPSSSGTFTVTGTDVHGCMNTFSLAVTVNGLPTISASASPSATVCNGNPVTLSGNGGVSYTWSNGVSNNVPFVPSSSGKYYVTGTDVNGCSNQDSMYIKVNALPVVGANATPASTVCMGSQLKLEGTGAVAYAWNRGVYNSVYFIPDSSGAYVVTGTDANGCTNNDTISVTVNPAPIITVSSSPSSTVCKGSSLSLTASGGISYSWSDGISNSVPFTPSASGNYIVTGTDGNGCSARDTVAVTVNNLPVITISGPASICNGSSTTLTAGGASTYSWSTGSTNNNITVNPTTTTSYTVTGTDGVTGCVNSQSIGVVVNSLPTLSISSAPSTAICQGSTITLTGSGAASYSWSGGITNGKAFTPSTSGMYTLTGTGSNGCSDTASIMVMVNPAPAVTITATPSATTCKGSDITLNGNGALGYTWSNGITDGVPFIPGSSGTYTVTGTDMNGCTGTASVLVTVNSLPYITAAAIPSTMVCKGSSVTLNGSGGTTYSWSNGVTDGIAFIPAKNQTYTVTGTDANGCSNKATITLSISPLPKVSFATLSFGDTLCKGAGAKIISGGLPYGGYYTGPFVTGNIFNPSTAGKFDIVYTYVDSVGCSDTAGHMVNVEICTGVNEVAENTGIEIYPNPTEKTLFIKFGQIPSDELQISVFDVTGKMINKVQEQVNKQIVPVSVESLPAGIYLLKLNTNSDQKIFRFIKQ